jgi:hypothetical protein
MKIFAIFFAQKIFLLNFMPTSSVLYKNILFNVKMKEIKISAVRCRELNLENFQFFLPLFSFKTNDGLLINIISGH